MSVSENSARDRFDPAAVTKEFGTWDLRNVERGLACRASYRCAECGFTTDYERLIRSVTKAVAHIRSAHWLTNNRQRNTATDRSGGGD